jgi:hypothetical protein
MPRLRISLILICLCCVAACSPRDFLTRRLAADLIAGSPSFKTTQQFWLRTGVIASKDYASPEYLVLQHRGWITGAAVQCTPNAPRSAPPACWDVALTPLGVETFRDLIPKDAAVSQFFSVPVAKRELVEVTGISKEGNFADVEFRWKWTPLNEVGAALNAGGVQYNSTVAFRHYDDGWRLIESNAPRSNQNLDDALKNAETAQ